MNKETIVIDDGLKCFELANKNGEVFAELIFNPADTSIISRYDALISWFRDYDYDSETDSVEFIKKFNTDVSQEFNNLFKRNVSESLFKVYEPMAIMGNGDFFAEILISYIGQIIEKELDVKLKEKQAKIKKATAKYK